MGDHEGEEVTVDELVETNGLTYQKFTDVPFTGKTTGEVQGTFKDGVLDGPWVGDDRVGISKIRIYGADMLEMKQECLECGCVLSLNSNAKICSFECTYCEACAEKYDYKCKNCDGELVSRPKRAKS